MCITSASQPYNGPDKKRRFEILYYPQFNIRRPHFQRTPALAASSSHALILSAAVSSFQFPEQCPPMAASPRRSTSEPPNVTAFLLILRASSPAAAQLGTEKPAAMNDGLHKSSMSPMLTTLIIAIIVSFFLLAFLSVYFTRRTSSRSAVTSDAIVGNGAGQSRRRVPRGLDTALLRSFPAMVYSDVKEHKLGKESLECAVCLCEFEDEDILRLLPRCGHVFHCDCIDVWLDIHVTCPVCRCDLAASANDPSPGSNSATVDVLQEDANNVDSELDLVRIRSQRMSGSVSMIPLSSRSRGDTAPIVAIDDRSYRLQLPEDMWREVVQQGASFDQLAWGLSR